ncbi:MAG: hypothetical protein ACXQTI_10645 [Candidatus Nezhaarchaeales archaeon]
MGHVITVYIRDDDVHLLQKLKEILKRQRRSISSWFMEQVEKYLEEIENEAKNVHKERA